MSGKIPDGPYFAKTLLGSKRKKQSDSSESLDEPVGQRPELGIDIKTALDQLTYGSEEDEGKAKVTTTMTVLWLSLEAA